MITNVDVSVYMGCVVKIDKCFIKCMRLFVQSHTSYSNIQIKPFKKKVFVFM